MAGRNTGMARRFIAGNVAVQILPHEIQGLAEKQRRGKILLAVEPVGEVDPADPAVGVDGDPQRFDVVAAVGPPREVREVELDLVPALVEAHGHGADEGLDARGGLVVAGAEPPPDVLVVEHLHLEGEVFLELRGAGRTFLMIMTRKGSLIPKVSLSFCGQVMKAVVTLVPIISSTDDWMSWSVIRFMCPFWTKSRSKYFAYPRSAAACFRSSTGSTGTPIGMCS